MLVGLTSGIRVRLRTNIHLGRFSSSRNLFDCNENFVGRFSERFSVATHGICRGDFTKEIQPDEDCGKKVKQIYFVFRPRGRFVEFLP